MTIHQGKHGPYVLLADIAPVERALLCAWLTGMERPAGVAEDAVWLRDYLEFRRQARTTGLPIEEQYNQERGTLG